MRYCGMIGYELTVDDGTGIYTPIITERKAKGDVESCRLRISDGVSINSDFKVNNKISIVSEPFSLNNFQNIRYASWKGTRWKVDSVEIDMPRIILTLGGEWNGQIAT